MQKNSFYIAILFFTAFFVTAFCLMTGSFVQVKERVQVGSVAPERYVAQKESVDTVATQKLRDEAAKSVGPLYKHDEQVQINAIAEMEALFNTLDELLTSNEEENFVTRVKKESLKLPVVLSERQYKAYEALSAEDRKAFQNLCIGVATEIYEQGVTAESLEKGKELARVTDQQIPWGGDVREMANAIITSAITPNLIPDQEAMLLAREKKIAEISDVIIKKNQKIVDEGEIVTSDIYETLDNLNLINNQNYKDTLAPILGSLGVLVLAFAAVFLFFFAQWKQEELKRNEMAMLFTVYIIMVLILQLMSKITTYTLVPLVLFPMMISILLSLRVALFLNCFMSVLGCLIFGGDVEFLLYFFITGIFAALLMKYTEKRKYVVLVAVAMALINFISMMALGLSFEKGYSTGLLLYSGYGAFIGIISVIIAIGSLPFWEAVFEANTPIRLLELTNPNNEILRRLMIEAPGTYHHSLIVANLAETAAYEIGANATLARVGSYYHDIGKLKYPLYFGENQGGENPHDLLEPYSSANLIIEHAKAGVLLGQEKGLPKAIISIIGEHQGTTLVKYFYYKALKQYGAENVKEEDYRYSGPIPQSKEAAVVMLSDTVEAAVRSVLGSGQTLAEAETLIQTLIRDKLEDGQLNKSNLAISDLELIGKSFMNVFHGMYHSRVAYPKPEEMKQAKEKNVVIKREDLHNDSVS